MVRIHNRRTRMSVLFLLFACCRTDGFAKALSTNLPSTPAHTQVKVCVERQLPAVSTPEQARKEFLKFVWEHGGGLPILVLPRKTREETLDLETTLQRRKLFPILMEEELVLTTQSSDSASVSTTPCQLQYQVTNGGLLSAEIVPGSHLGTVTFAPQQDTGIITLIWDVVFDTKEASRTFLWQFVTEQTITDSCNNFQMAMAVPRLYQRTTMLSFDSKSLPASTTPEKFMMDEWIQFCWREGSGFPLPLPPIIPNGDEVRWIVPPFLKERLLSTNTRAAVKGTNKLCSEILYQVDNPSIFTYQVHSHRGRIRFLPVQDNRENDIENANDADMKQVQMDWQIEIRPYHGFSNFVEAFTGAVVSCYARNFKCHVQEGPDAMVDLKPPRGGGNDASSLLQIRKDSWLGGVLDTHLQDKRSTFDQTVALFQPWTWGRSANYDGEDEGELWVDGYLSE